MLFAIGDRRGYISGKKLISGICKSFLTPGQQGKGERDTLNADFSRCGSANKEN